MKSSRALQLMDRYIGKPLCRLLSLLSIWNRLDLSIPKEIKKILVVELFEMGASIMIAPSMLYLLKEKPDADLYCLTTTNMKGSWEILKLVPPKNIFLLKDQGLLSFLFSALVLIFKMRKIKFDLVIDYELFLRVSAVLVGLLRAKRKAGFYQYELEGLSRGKIYNIPCSFNQNMHIAKNFLALTKTAIQDRKDYPNFKDAIRSEELVLPEYHSDNSAKQSLLSKLARLCPEDISKKHILVVSHDVGLNLSIRNYPSENFVVVIKDLLKKNSDLYVILVGTKGEENSARQIYNKVSDERCFSLCGVTTLKELFELIHMASAVLCNDNGVGHFAALTRTPAVALFSTDSPTVYGPLGPCTVLYSFFHCSPCISALNYKNSKCVDNKCLQVISTDLVNNAVQKIFEGKIPFGTVNNSIFYYR